TLNIPAALIVVLAMVVLLRGARESAVHIGGAARPAGWDGAVSGVRSPCPGPPGDRPRRH
ncbi:hypothetical protein ABZ372_55610, partial [Streptomyces sp. NPDC005921]